LLPKEEPDEDGPGVALAGDGNDAPPGCAELSVGDGGGRLGALIGGKFLIAAGKIEEFLGRLTRNPGGGDHVTLWFESNVALL
jgi:hypothetical protein